MTQLELGVDGRMLASSGIGRYLRDLLGQICRLDPELQLAVAGNQTVIRQAARDQAIPSSQLRIIDYEAPLYSVREQIEGAYLFSRLRADILLFPNYNVPLFLRRPFVVVMHDVTHIRFREAFGRIRSHLAQCVMTSALSRSRWVFTNSRTTQHDISLLSPRSADKISTIAPAASAIFAPASATEIDTFRASCGLPKCYAITVGIRKSHKNLAVAAKAVAEVRRRGIDLSWIVVGRKFDPVDDVDRSAAILGPALVELNSVSDAELRMLYGGAVALLLPSLWEGFGYPAVEAASCGTPVISSDIGAIRELLAEGALYCSPTDASSFVNALTDLLENPQRRSEMGRVARERARLLSWETSGQQALQVLRSFTRH